LALGLKNLINAEPVVLFGMGKSHTKF